MLEKQNYNMKANGSAMCCLLCPQHIGSCQGHKAALITANTLIRRGQARLKQMDRGMPLLSRICKER